MYEQSLRKYPPYHLPKLTLKSVPIHRIVNYPKTNKLRSNSLVNYLLAYTQKQPLFQSQKCSKNIIIVQKPALQKLRHRKVKTQCRQLETQFKNELSSLKKQVKNLASQLKQQKQSRFTQQVLLKLARKNNTLSCVNNYSSKNQTFNQKPNNSNHSNIFNSIQTPLINLQQSSSKYEFLTKKIKQGQNKKKIYYTSKHYNSRYKMISKFKKVANAVLFLIYLRKYKQRITLKKLTYFQKNQNNQVPLQILKIKDIFTNSVLAFLQKVTWKNQFNLIIQAKDNQSLMVQKYTYAKKYINILLDNLSQIQFNKSYLQKIIEPTYFLCKHGNFGVHYSFYTLEQLDIMCVAEQQYIRADKNLQKIQIITLLFIKVFLFNMILRPWKISEIQFHQKSINNKNLILIGGLIYRLVRDIQNSYLKIIGINYSVGNWKRINSGSERKHIYNNAKYNKIKGCKSMILQQQFMKENKGLQLQQNIQNTQLIFGVLSKKYAQQYYNITQWKGQKRKIIDIVNLVHNRISHYHKTIAKKCL